MTKKVEVIDGTFTVVRSDGVRSNPIPWNATKEVITEEIKKLFDQNQFSYNECKDLGLPTCQSGSDGDCSFKDCPQLKDNEPEKTGRHCPLDWNRSEDYQ